VEGDIDPITSESDGVSDGIEIQSPEVPVAVGAKDLCIGFGGVAIRKKRHDCAEGLAIGLSAELKLERRAVSGAFVGQA
jgi:hypothetical protein